MDASRCSYFLDLMLTSCLIFDSLCVFSSQQIWSCKLWRPSLQCRPACVHNSWQSWWSCWSGMACSMDWFVILSDSLYINIWVIAFVVSLYRCTCPNFLLLWKYWAFTSTWKRDQVITCVIVVIECFLVLTYLSECFVFYGLWNKVLLQGIILIPLYCSLIPEECQG